jgi:hypothetical protein
VDRRIGDPDYRADTKFGVGDNLDLWIGGALQDWFTFGIGTSFGSLYGNDVVGGLYLFSFRVEMYPFFYQGKAGRDFGLFTNFGLGGYKLYDAESEEQIADGGAVSLVGVGAVYEAFHFGSFAAGPTLEYRHLFSESLKHHSAILGMRILWYSGP